MEADLSQAGRRERPVVVSADGYPVGGLASAAEAAAFLSLSRSGVRKMMQSGVLPSVRLARRAVRVPWSAVRAFAAGEVAQAQ
jgi:excisionase family DNA binding protein